MWFGEPHPFPEGGSPTRLSASGQQSYEGWSCRIYSIYMYIIYVIRISVTDQQTVTIRNIQLYRMFQYNPLGTGSSGQVGEEGRGKAVPVHAMTACRGGGGRRIALFILNQAPDRNEWLTSRFGRFIPGDRSPHIHWIGGWVGPRAGLDVSEKIKMYCPSWESNHDTSSVQPVA